MLEFSLKACFLGSLLAGLSSSAMGTTILMDFGRSETATVSFNGEQYNDVSIDLLNNTTAPEGTLPALHTINGIGTSLALVDTTGAPTGISLTVARVLNKDAGASGGGGNSGAGGDYPGTKPAAVSSFAPSATSDGFFSNNGNVMAITFSGLNTSLTYDLLTYGGRPAGSAPAEGYELIAGTPSVGDSFQAIAVQDNSTVAPFWGGISPDVDGEISFLLRTDTTVNYTSGTISALNFASLTVVPEPATISLLGLGGLVLLRRRR
jgi:hypothetical protein